MPLEDKQLRLRCMREIARRNVDSSRMDLECRGDVVYMRGRLRPLRGRGARIDMSKELEAIKQNLLRIPGIRDIVDRDLVVIDI